MKINPIHLKNAKGTGKILKKQSRFKSFPLL